MTESPSEGVSAVVVEAPVDLFSGPVEGMDTVEVLQPSPVVSAATVIPVQSVRSFVVSPSVSEGGTLSSSSGSFLSAVDRCVEETISPR